MQLSIVLMNEIRKACVLLESNAISLRRNKMVYIIRGRPPVYYSCGRYRYWPGSQTCREQTACNLLKILPNFYNFFPHSSFFSPSFPSDILHPSTCVDITTFTPGYGDMAGRAY